MIKHCFSNILPAGRLSFQRLFHQTTPLCNKIRVVREIGVVEAYRDPSSNYDCGQLFIHKLFGYRGIILFPWLSKIRDLDTSKANTETDKKPENPDSQAESSGEPTDKVDQTANSITYDYYMYQALIDERDWEAVSGRLDTQAVSDLASRNAASTATIPITADNQPRPIYVAGSDLVMHSHIIPYNSTEEPPIQHTLFSKFLQQESTFAPSESNGTSPPAELKKLTGQRALQTWKQRLLPRLEATSVYRQTTEGIQVSVLPYYVGCREGDQEMEYIWRYVIWLENTSRIPIQLRERFWRIFTPGSDTLKTIKGRGVVGNEPILSPAGDPGRAFQYCSFVTVGTQEGDMWGTYLMERLTDRSTFHCRIPAFRLTTGINT